MVRSWLRKASHDLAAASRLGTEEPTLPDVASYHCQQAAEKALKGFLAFHNERVAKVHDVGMLLEQASAIEPGFRSYQDMADRLTPLATLYRYPGPVADLLPEELEQAIEDATAIVRQVLASLPEAVHPLVKDP